MMFDSDVTFHKSQKSRMSLSSPGTVTVGINFIHHKEVTECSEKLLIGGVSWSYFRKCYELILTLLFPRLWPLLPELVNKQCNSVFTYVSKWPMPVSYEGLTAVFPFNKQKVKIYSYLVSPCFGSLKAPCVEVILHKKYCMKCLMW